MIPKSLHTVTVLVNVSNILADVYGPTVSNAELVDLAAAHLGYGDAADVYSLKGQAVKKLDKTRKVTSRPAKLSLVA